MTSWENTKLRHEMYQPMPFSLLSISATYLGVVLNIAFYHITVVGMPLYRHPAGIQGQLHTSRFPASSSALLPAIFFTSHHISYLPLLYQVLFKEIGRMEPRDASHAGSWYSDSQRTLSRQLDQWLAQVPDQI